MIKIELKTIQLIMIIFRSILTSPIPVLEFLSFFSVQFWFLIEVVSYKKNVSTKIHGILQKDKTAICAAPITPTVFKLHQHLLISVLNQDKDPFFLYFHYEKIDRVLNTPKNAQKWLILRI